MAKTSGNPPERRRPKASRQRRQQTPKSSASRRAKARDKTAAKPRAPASPAAGLPVYRPGKPVPRQAGAELREREITRLRRRISELQEQLRAIERGAPPPPTQTPARLEALEHELERRQMAAEREREVARDFQQRLLPSFLPRMPGVSYAVHLWPAPLMGGDLYDVYEPGPGSIGFFLADPSGHGLRAALLAAIAKNAFDIFRSGEYSPRAVLEKLNLSLLAKIPENQFLTAFHAIFDCATMRLRYVNAAYAEPIVYGPGRFERLAGRGAFLGLFDQPDYEEKEIQLRPGDRLLIYSDGVAHELDPAGMPYGVERLEQFIRANDQLTPGQLLLKIREDLDRHAAAQPAADDAALLAAAFVRATIQIESIEIDSEPGNLPRVVSPIIKRLQAAGYGERALFGVQLALEEALINAMKHGNRMDRLKKIKVSYALDDRKVAIHVSDEGAGFDPRAVPDPTQDENLEVAHGRGLLLMRAYVDELTFNAKGDEVTLVKYAPWA